MTRGSTRPGRDPWDAAHQASEDAAASAAQTLLDEAVPVRRRRDGATLRWVVRVGEGLELAWGADDPAAPHEGDPVPYVPWEVRELLPEGGAAQIRCGAWVAGPAGADPAALTDTLREVMRRYGVRTWG